MKQKSTLITLLLVVAVLILGIAYAALATQTLEVQGTASVEFSESNFDVTFTKAEVDATNSTFTPVVAISESNSDIATMDVEGLTTKGQKAVAKFTIKNTTPEATGLDASLNISAMTPDNEWIKTTALLEPTSALAPQGEAILTVTVELLETPGTEAEVAEANANTTISVKVDAEPA